MRFGHDDAVAMHLRLAMGLSAIDDQGDEVRGPGKPPRTRVPSVDELLTRYGTAPRDAPPTPAPRAYGGLQAARQAADKQRRLEADRERESREAAERRILAAVREREASRRALPCYPLDPTVNPAGHDLAAARACHAVRAHLACDWRRHAPQTCPRERVDAAYTAAAQRLSEADVPTEYAARVLAALPGCRDAAGRRIPSTPLDERPALAAVRDWLASSSLLLFLSGEMRCGKSLALGWGCGQMSSRWVSAAALCGVPLSRWDPAPYLGPDLLAIDDLGAEPLTDFGRSRLYAVIADRHADRRRTAITTNAVRSVLAHRYDERLDRRLEESGRWVRLPAWEGAR